MSYLNQTMIVSNLLEIVNRTIPMLVDSEIKRELHDALSEFETAITPSAIYLEEIFEYAALANVKLTQEQAVEILKSAALDIDCNYVSKAVEYHVDEFIRN
jgi:hypothetical protein